MALALFKIAKGSASNLSTSTISKKPIEGYCWFTTDDGRFYIDTSTSTNNAVIGTNRIAINGVHTASNSWTAGSSAGPTLSITINDITSTAAAIPSASATASGIVTTGNQIFAGIKTFSNNGQYPIIRFKPAHSTNNGNDTYGPASIFINAGSSSVVSKNNMQFRMYSPTSTSDTTYTSYYEAYLLPDITVGRTANGAYSILTTKNTVTIAQGGTSATTAGAAANNLLLGLPTWTANPTDDTYFIRRDTAGGDAFGQVKASTIYNYIAGKTTVSNTWTGGTTAGPTIKTTVNGVTGTAVAIPSASKTASGVVTTGDQDFKGKKGFGYMARYGRTDTGAATRWVADTFLYNDAGTQVGEFWYDCGDATNITTGQYVLSQYSPNSTANTSTTGKKENYKLPVVTSGLTENANYNILTSKNAVTIAQGGTGATTAAGARANLGTWSLVSDSYNTLMPADGTTNNWVKIGKANTSYGLLPSQSGGAGAGHNYLGTSSWYWKYAYIDEIYGHLNGPADALNFVHTNELILGNSTSQSRVWFNYRRVKDGATSGNTAITEYRFGNGNAGTSGVTLYAANFTGNAATATLPLGFSSQSTNATWGNTTGTTVTAWNDSSGGSIDFRKDNPSSGKLSIKVDGRFYGNEGTYPAMLMNYNNGYWGLGSDPDGGYSGWVRAPASGILTSAKNASSVGSGVGAIGAIEWRFAHVYADTLHGNAETATKANGLVDGSSTMTSAYNKAGLAYSDYTWLAGWNGYELRAVNKSQFAQASHSHAYLPLAGGTMNDERAITFQITRKKNGGGGWAYSPIRMVGNDNAEFAGIGVYGGANTMTYMYIGANAYNGNNLYIYPDGHIWATKVYGAVWNDYAEYRTTKDIIEPGRCVIETGNDDLVLSTSRLQPGAEIVSDTFGFAIGETDEAKTPIATTGRVLAYIYEGREAARAAIGKPVCSGPDGTVSIMTDEEYQKYGYCAIGTISAVPDYEEWGTENIKVNNRIWIRIR